jgi:hypothetical protein
MNKEFVSYEIALKLKELGFKEQCFSFYDIEKNLYASEGYYKIGYNVLNEEVIAPLYQQVFRWFREEHNWQSLIEATNDQHSNRLVFNYCIWNSKTGEIHHSMLKDKPSGDWCFTSYEEAQIACILDLISVIKIQVK